MTRRIRTVSTISDDYLATLEGQPIDEQSFDPDRLVSGEDVDVLKPDGSPLIVFRHRVIPAAVCLQALPALKRAASRESYNRGAAAGGRYHKRKLDGSLSNTAISKPVHSAIIGFYDREPRTPFCRTTAFTAQDVRGWKRVQPYIRAVDRVFQRHLPERYEAQMEAVRATPPDYIIPGTAFTTVTVNDTWPTNVHKDEGDLAEGFGVMSVIDSGQYTGGLLVFPKFRVAVDMRLGDVLLADVHEFHGNTKLIGVDGTYDRISTVFYFRSHMVDCLPPDEELHRLKRRRPGDPLS